MKLRLLKNKLKSFGNVKHYKNMKCIVLKTNCNLTMDEVIYCFDLERNIVEKQTIEEKNNLNDLIVLTHNQAFKELKKLRFYLMIDVFKNYGRFPFYSNADYNSLKLREILL